MPNTTDKQPQKTAAPACCAGCEAEPEVVEDVDHSDLDDAAPYWVRLPAN